MVKVKICGITNIEDAEAASRYGADLLGFIFVEGTPRYIEKSSAGKIIETLNSSGFSDIKKVGLFIDEEIDSVVDAVSLCGLDCVQLAGSETPAYCSILKEKLLEKCERNINIIKVFKVAEKILPNGSYDITEYENVDNYIFDTFDPQKAGGIGKQFDCEIILREKDKLQKPFFIAGGLTADKVQDIVQTVTPYGVDVSSGVEREPGKKDAVLLKEFIQNAKSA
ncbi:MAG: phosphoribosylanthranilate isomerase [Candidatus Aadella gelida]|nr:phosphoribosylanthranilate isomerase [Candidatus Aadella gelida]